MNITVYIQDELGKRAKEANLSLSALFQGAVIEELQRREIVESTLEEAQTLELDLEDEEGVAYTGRVTGKSIAETSDRTAEVILAEDERVIIYDRTEGKYWISADPETELERLDEQAYRQACTALGIKAVIDI